MIRYFSWVLLAISCAPASFAEDIVTGNFEMVDHHGETVTEHNYDGKLRLVFFGFTQCPDVCPTTLVEVAQAMRRLGDDADEVQPIFISVDLENDTTDQLARYVAAFHPSLVGLTGSREQLDATAAAFNVTYGVELSVDGGSAPDKVFHSAYLFLMDRQGGFLDVFGYGTKADVIAATLRDYL